MITESTTRTSLCGSMERWPDNNRSTRAPRFCNTERVRHEKPPLRFADLFAGIGGFHLAFDRAGAVCVYAADNDPYARKTYEANFAASSPELFARDLFAGDVRSINADDIPDFDILCAGFPCQPFSIVGRRQGFEDTRGTLFFDIARIIEAKQPAAFFLENVQGLLSHDGGATFAAMRSVLEESLGYSLHYKIVRACDFGLPQLRPRLFMVGFRDKETPFKFPEPIPLTTTMGDVLGGSVERAIGRTVLVGGRGHQLGHRRNWDGYLVNGNLHRLTVAETAAMQGFPPEFSFPVSTSQAMKQLGNAVAIAPVEATARALVKAIRTRQTALSAAHHNATNPVSTRPTEITLERHSA